MNLTTKTLAITAGICVLAGSASAQFVVDGSISEALYGGARAAQLNPTEFGVNGDGSVNVATGSQLDAAYAAYGGNTLYLGLTGALESNFNKLVVFVDTGVGGFNTLTDQNPGTDFGFYNTLNGLTFDTGFNASHAFHIRNGGDSLFASLVSLGEGGSELFDGGNNEVADSGALRVNGLEGMFQAALNNSWNGGSPGNGFTGAEFGINLGLLGNPTGPLRFTAFITSGSGDFLSNQVLGSLPQGFEGNLGGPGGVNFSAIDGNQFFEIEAIPEPTTLGVLALGAALLARRKRKA